MADSPFAAFWEGFNRSAQQIRAQKQQGADRQSDKAMQQAQLENMKADNARAEQQARIERLMNAAKLLDGATTQQTEHATDPTQAENALLQRSQQLESAFELQPSALAGMVPSMTGPLSARKKRRAQELYDQAVKLYGEEQVANDAITIQHEAFGAIKPSQLRALFAPPAVDATGQPAVPMTGKRTPPTPGSFEEYVDAEPGRRAHIEGSRRRYLQSDDRAGGNADEPLVAVIDPISGKPILRRRSHAEGLQPAAGREQGRPVLSSDANRIAELDTSLDDVATLKQTLSVPGATGVRAKAGAMLPSAVTELTGLGTEAKQRQATIDRVKQVIGKALEGGVLRKEDEYKYVKILPTIQDPPEVAASKLTGLEEAIRLRRQRTLESLGDAGYDTARFQARPSRGGGRFEILEVK